jgi:hypothetical protein
MFSRLNKITLVMSLVFSSATSFAEETDQAVLRKKRKPG